MVNHYEKAHKHIKKLIDRGLKNFIIFPMGKHGIMVKNMLNIQFGIKEIALIDNELSKTNSSIIPLSALKNLNLDKTKILLASDNERIYSEIRAELMEYVSIDQFIDLFSCSPYFDKDMYFQKKSYIQDRYTSLECAVREIYRNHVDGDIAECGVYKGEFANMMSRLMPDRKLYLFDTFEGFDARDITESENTDSETFRRENPLNDTSVEKVLSIIGYRANAVLRKGWFPDTAKGLEDCRFAFVRLDTDLYAPIYAGLEFFYPRMMRGGTSSLMI